MASARAKNTATVDDVRRALKGAVGTLATEKFKSADLVVVTDAYEKAILDVLRLTPRPCLSILKAAAVQAFSPDGNSVEECELMGSRLYDAIVMCKAKSKSMTSGKKLEPSVFRICSWLAKQASGGATPEKRTSTGSLSSTGSACARKSKFSCQQEERTVKPRTGTSIQAAVFELYGMESLGGPSSSSSLARFPTRHDEEIFVMSSQETSPLKPNRLEICDQDKDVLQLTSIPHSPRP